MDGVHVATLNIRNLMDRWDERLPLLIADMAALQPDLLGLQEVVFPLQQDRIIGAAGAAHYRVVRGWAGRPEFGCSVLVRDPLETSDESRVDLGRDREAHRVTVWLPGGTRVTFGTTHLYHPPDAHRERDEQVAALVEWLDAAPPVDALIVTGDFNADPREPAYERMVRAGVRSAHLEANGSESAATWPSGLVAPAMDTDGDPDCLDYIFVRGAARTLDCRLVFDRPAAGDPTLYPSDHLGLAAHLEIGGVA